MTRVFLSTEPFLQHTSDYDSGCDTASASTGERLASPQGGPLSASHSHLRALSIPLVPVDSPTSSGKSIDVKRERLDEEEAEPEPEPEPVNTAESEWTKGSESEWVTDMSSEQGFGFCLVLSLWTVFRAFSVPALGRTHAHNSTFFAAHALSHCTLCVSI